MMCVGRPVPGMEEFEPEGKASRSDPALQRGLLYSQRRAGEFVPFVRQPDKSVVIVKNNDPREHEPGYRMNLVPSPANSRRAPVAR